MTHVCHLAARDALRRFFSGVSGAMFLNVVTAVPTKKGKKITP
jgi:hypothetical protein